MGTGLGKFSSKGDSFCDGRDNDEKAVEMADFASSLVSDTKDIRTDSDEFEDCAAVDSDSSTVFPGSGSVGIPNECDSLERDLDSFVAVSSNAEFISNSLGFNVLES